MAQLDEIRTHVCLRDYMHAFARVHLSGRVRTSRWHVDAKPTRAVPYACFSVTFHLHLTPIPQIPNFVPRGLDTSRELMIILCLYEFCHETQETFHEQNQNTKFWFYVSLKLLSTVRVISHENSHDHFSILTLLVVWSFTRVSIVYF